MKPIDMIEKAHFDMARIEEALRLFLAERSDT